MNLRGLDNIQHHGPSAKGSSLHCSTGKTSTSETMPIAAPRYSRGILTPRLWRNRLTGLIWSRDLPATIRRSPRCFTNHVLFSIFLVPSMMRAAQGCLTTRDFMLRLCWWVKLNKCFSKNDYNITDRGKERKFREEIKSLFSFENHRLIYKMEYFRNCELRQGVMVYLNYDDHPENWNRNIAEIPRFQSWNTATSLKTKYDGAYKYRPQYDSPHCEGLCHFFNEKINEI